MSFHRIDIIILSSLLQLRKLRAQCPVKISMKSSSSQAFQTSLTTLRQEIDQLDQTIITCIMKRLLFSYQVGTLKRQYNQPIYHLQREHDIIENILSKKQQTLQRIAKTFKQEYPNAVIPSKSELNRLLSKQTLTIIYHELIAASRATEKPLRVAHIGSPGSFSYIAARKLFGSSSEFVAYHTFQRIFQALANEEEMLAVIPIENSTEGIVGTTVDLMVNTDVTIIKEFFMPIRLALLSQKTKLNDIKTILSHPQPFQQAIGWLSEHLPDVTVKETQSTIHAAELACRQPTAACITSEELAIEYPKLKVLRKNIEDVHHNTTRFIVLKHNSPTSSQAHLTLTPPNTEAKTAAPWVTTVIFATKDKSGSLVDTLKFFKTYKLNMSNLVSRPSKKKAFHYLFYVDFIGDQAEPHVKKALQALRKHCTLFKCFGSYTRGINPAFPHVT